MQVKLEKISDLERKLTITIPTDRIKSAVQTKLHKIATSAKMPGFRPGKIPFDMLEKRYGESVRSEQIENLLRETYGEALKQEKLNPAGLPKIEIISSRPEEPFVYTATFEIFPEISLSDINQIKVERLIAKLDENDVNEALEKLRKEKVAWKEITDPSRKSQAQDQLTVEFTFKISGDPDKKITTEKDIKFVLGDGSMWEDFEKQLYGVASGEKKKFTLKFPKTHTDKDKAGKDAEFNVMVLKVCEPILPKLDDEFSKNFGLKEGGISGLKNEIRKNLERELQKTLKDLFKNAVMDKLLANNPIEPPKSLVEHELDQMAQRFRERFAPYQKSAKSNLPEFPREDFRKQAVHNVSLGLLLSALIKEHNIKIEPQELSAKVEDLASVYTDPNKAKEWYFSDHKRLMEVHAALLEDKALDYLTSKIEVTEKEVPYKDIIAKR